MPVPPLLAAAILVLVSPALAATGTVEVHAGDQALTAHAEASRDGAAVRADSPAGWQAAEVGAGCVPDWDSACDTAVDCEPGTLNCYAMRQPRDPWCVQQPDGSMHCKATNETEPANS